ncbi:MAG: toll/interleukin-1 receptor domain-containing protein [Acidobacteriota bacterium]
MNQQEDYFEIPKNIDRYLATLSKIYENDGNNKLQEIIVNSKIRIDEASNQFEDINGVWIHSHVLHLILPEPLYLSVADKKVKLENKIRVDLIDIHHVKYESIEAVHFEMEIDEENDWREDTGLLISHKKFIQSSAVERVWGKEGFRVFLSHKAEVKIETVRLKDQLSLYGISGFVAHKDIKPTKEWQTEIENALRTMDAFVALMTEDFHDSQWTDQEVGFAVARGTPTISVRLGKDPYGFIGKFQALPCTWEEASTEIPKLLIKNESMLNAYITEVQECKSFDAGNSLAELLPYIESLDDNQAKKLVSAFNENSQVRASFGFNGTKSQQYGKGLEHHLRRLEKSGHELFFEGKTINI